MNTIVFSNRGRRCHGNNCDWVKTERSAEKSNRVGADKVTWIPTWRGKGLYGGKRGRKLKKEKIGKKQPVVSVPTWSWDRGDGWQLECVRL